MPQIKLSDIRLKEYNFDNMPQIKRLREASMAAKAEVCIERALHVTRSLRESENSGEAMELRYARAVNRLLKQKEVCFFDDNLLAGTTTSKPYGAPVYPELTGLTIWPELDTISNRAKNPLRLSREDAESLNFEIYPFWLDRSILEYTRKETGNPGCMKLFERIVFYLASKVGTISHTVPYYKMALANGLTGIIEDAKQREVLLRSGANTVENGDKLAFYSAVRIAMEGVIAYAARLSVKATELAAVEDDPWRKKNLQCMSEITARVPAQPAQSFREAINAVWLLQVAIHAENINMAISPGRLDQILYPYYRADIDNGRLTVKEALELVCCLWLKLNDNTNLVPETAEELFGGAGTVPAVTVGGVDETGEDAVNDLTYIMLRATELLKTRDPSMNARFHYEKNPVTYRDRVADVIASTHAVPAVYNDLAAIDTLENQGVATAHARDYAIIGCVELSASGRSYDASSSIMLNLVSALELAMYNGKRPITGDEQIGPITGDPADFKTFDQFIDAFRKQLAFLITEAITLNEQLGKTHQALLPTPLLSALFDGPMECGKDLIQGGARYNASGATHIGFADTVDSLSAIQKAVFGEARVCSFEELITALQKNFEGEKAGKLLALLLNKMPKFGTDDPIATKNAKELVDFLYEFYQGHTNYRGGKYRPAYWTMTNHAGQGKLAGALPNGRKSFQVFASGITPVSQAAPDLTTCLRSVASLDSKHIPGGVAFNLKTVVTSQEDHAHFSQTLETYCRYGGLHVQFNILSYETLMDARLHPDKYPELLVRVSGYSAYFKDLNDAMKEEIITRTAYDLQSGKAIPFNGMDGTTYVAPTPVDPSVTWSLADHAMIRLAGNNLLESLESGLAEDFLNLLLSLMKLVFTFDRDFRRNIQDFDGNFLFCSSDGKITVSAIFKDNLMEVYERKTGVPNITINFKDSKALMNFLLTPKPDILGSMLRQEVTPDGNLNYLYKFGFMAKRLQLMATGTK